MDKDQREALDLELVAPIKGLVGGSQSQAIRESEMALFESFRKDHT